MRGCGGRAAQAEEGGAVVFLQAQLREDWQTRSAGGAEPLALRPPHQTVTTGEGAKVGMKSSGLSNENQASRGGEGRRGEGGGPACGLGGS